MALYTLTMPYAITQLSAYTHRLISSMQNVLCVTCLCTPILYAKYRMVIGYTYIQIVTPRI